MVLKINRKEVIILLAVAIFFLPSTVKAGIWDKILGKTEKFEIKINDDNFLRIKDELKIKEDSHFFIEKELVESASDKGIHYYKFSKIHVSDDVLEKSLNNEISSRIPNLTYGTNILTALYEMKIIDSISGSTWSQNKLINQYFDKMSEVNLWAKETQIVSEKILGSASGTVGSTILMLPKLFEVGINIKMLATTYKNKIFWWYFQQRSQGINSSEAFMDALQVAGSPVGGMPGIFLTPKEELTDNGRIMKEFLEKLWTEYSNGYDPDKGGLKEEFKNQYKEKLRGFLITSIKMVKEKSIPPTTKEHPEKSIWQKVKEIPKNISEKISDFFKKKEKDAKEAIKKKIEEESKKTAKKLEKALEKETKKCCIAEAAAYGTSLASKLDILRDFRDKFLLKRKTGEKLVKIYYKISPPIADFISQHPILRTIMREIVIEPIVNVVTATENIWEY